MGSLYALDVFLVAGHILGYALILGSITVAVIKLIRSKSAEPDKGILAAKEFVLTLLCSGAFMLAGISLLVLVSNC